MKYLSLLFIVFVMWGSWSAIRAPNLLTEDIHVGLQEDLKRVITEYIKENLPSAQDVRFDKFWTETVKANQVKATFAYTFDESENNQPETHVGVEGHAILNRAKDQNSEFDVWSLDELYVLNNHLEFKEGVTIHSATSSSAEEEN